MTGPTAATRKRRQADDLAESPPKRVTRARAARSTEEATTERPVAKKITTASARAAGASKPTKVTKTSAARKKADDAVTDKPAKKATEKATKATKASTAKATTRTRTAARNDQEVITEAESEAPEEAPKTRTRRAATATKEPVAASKVTKPSVRAKKTAPQSVEAPATEEAVIEPKRSTRGRPATTTTTTRAAANATRSTASTAARSAAPRKKVTFEDEATNDKENIPMASAGAKKAGPNKAATGIKARPVRRAAAPTRSAMRSKKPASEAAEAAAPESQPTPLSPKKIHQVAKSWSGSSEDELSERIPVRALSKSPVKNPVSPRKAAPQSPEKSTEASEDLSGAKDGLASSMRSPAKRPPASPFKDTLRESPKKFVFSPKKDDGPQEIAQPLFKDSIKQSPKKANFLASITPARELQPTQTPLKASLLASPARRPSPEKVAAMISPGKSTLALPAIEPTMDAGSREVMQPLTPGTSAPTPAKTTAEACAVSNECLETTPRGLNEAEYEASVPTGLEGQDCMLVEAADGALTPPGLPEPTKADVPRVTHTPKFRSAPSLDDSESEDELVAFQARKTTPARQTRRSSRYRRSVATPGVATVPNGDLGITPLAVQLSSWLAASPEKHAEPEAADDVEQPHGIFANIRGAASVRESTSSNDSAETVITHSSPRFFADQMAVSDLEAVQVHEDHGRDGEPEDEAMADADEVASQATENYGDENALPAEMASTVASPATVQGERVTRTILAETMLLDDVASDPGTVHEDTSALDRGLENASPLVEVHAAVVTPMRRSPLKRREVHTVSKVPLRPDGGRSPIKILKKRSKSLANTLEASGDAVRQALAANASADVEQPELNSELNDDIMDDVDSADSATPPRPAVSENPPATMPVKSRKLPSLIVENGSPIKIQKKRGKSMGHALGANEQDPRTYLAPSTSYGAGDVEASDEEAELAQVAATHRAV